MATVDTQATINVAMVRIMDTPSSVNSGSRYTATPRSVGTTSCRGRRYLRDRNTKRADIAADATAAIASRAITAALIDVAPSGVQYQAESPATADNVASRVKRTIRRSSGTR